MTKLDITSGKVDQVKGTTAAPTDMRMDGTWYSLYNTTATAGDALKDTDGKAIAVDNTYEFVVINGYVYNAELVTGSATKVGLITGVTSNTDFDGYVQARMMLTDGSVVDAYMSEVKSDASSSKTLATTDIGKLVTYEQDGDRYKLYFVGKDYAQDTNDAKAMAGYDAVAGITDGTVSSGSWDEDAGTVAGKKVNDSAVVFVQSIKSATDNTKEYKVISGKDLNSWKSDWGDIGGGLYSNSGLGYLDVVVIGVSTYKATPGATTNFGYVTSNVSIGSDSISFYLWDGSAEKSIEVTEKVSSNSAVKKGAVVSFDWDGDNVVKNVTAVGDLGAIEYSNGTQVKIDGTGYDLADDVTILNVNSDKQEGIPGSAITEAQEDVGGWTYSNAYYQLNSDGEIELLVVDVQNNRWSGANKVLVGKLSPSKDVINDALTAAGDNGTVVVTGTLPASGVSQIKAGQTLVLTSAQTTSSLEALTADAGATLVIQKESTGNNVSANKWFHGANGSATAYSGQKVPAATYEYSSDADGNTNAGWVRPN